MKNSFKGKLQDYISPAPQGSSAKRKKLKKKRNKEEQNKDGYAEDRLDTQPKQDETRPMPGQLPHGHDPNDENTATKSNNLSMTN